MCINRVFHRLFITLYRFIIYLILYLSCQILTIERFGILLNKKNNQ
jgi:hypothetical protein